MIYNEHGGVQIHCDGDLCSNSVDGDDFRDALNKAHSACYMIQKNSMGDWTHTCQECQTA